MQKEQIMDPQLMIQGTPNPNALKFVVNMPVKSQGNWTYRLGGEYKDNPLAQAIFELDAHIREVYFFDSYITVTQDGLSDWEELEGKIRAVILAKIKDHDPNFKTEEPQKAKPFVMSHNPEMAQINEILDQTIRPALQMDGGDIELIGYENDVLRILYQGACGSCPSASMGTLQVIENILRDRFNPRIIVELAEFY